MFFKFFHYLTEKNERFYDKKLISKHIQIVIYYVKITNIPILNTFHKRLYNGRKRIIHQQHQ